MSDEQLRQDELISAYLDGEATPAEVAEVEASDVLLARVEEFRAMRDAVAGPVVPLSAEQRDDLIGAALRVADAEAADRVEAAAVRMHRPRRLLLAMAAAVIVLAAVAGTRLLDITSGDDDQELASTAADAPAMESAAAPAADEAPAEEAPMAEMDMAPAEAMAEPEPMAEEAPMAQEAPMDEAIDDLAAPAPTAPEFEAAEEAAEVAEAAMAAEEAAAEELPAPTTAPVVSTDDSDDAEPGRVVDLGPLESLESLFENIGASWSAALEAGSMADPGACADAVHEQALELNAETLRSFVATVGTANPATFDARFVRRADGTAVIVYAASPGCEIGTHELPDS